MDKVEIVVPVFVLEVLAVLEDNEIGVSPFGSSEVAAVELADVDPVFALAVLEDNRNGVSLVVSAVMVDGIDDAVAVSVGSVSPGEVAVVVTGIGVSPVVCMVVAVEDRVPVGVEEGLIEVDEKEIGISLIVEAEVEVIGESEAVVSVIFTGSSPVMLAEVVNMEEEPTEVVDDKLIGVSPIVGSLVVTLEVVSSVTFMGKVGVVVGTSDVVVSDIFIGKVGVVLVEVVEEGPAEVVDDNRTGVSPKISEVVTVEEGPAEVVDDNRSGVSPEISEVVTVVEGPAEVVDDKRIGVSPIVGPLVVTVVVVSSVTLIGKVGVVVGTSVVDDNRNGVSPDISEVVTVEEGPSEVVDDKRTGVSPEISEVVIVEEGPAEVVDVTSIVLVEVGPLVVTLGVVVIDVNITGVSPMVEAEVDVTSIVLVEVLVVTLEPEINKYLFLAITCPILVG